MKVAKEPYVYTHIYIYIHASLPIVRSLILLGVNQPVFLLTTALLNKRLSDVNQSSLRIEARATIFNFRLRIL